MPRTKTVVAVILGLVLKVSDAQAAQPTARMLMDECAIAVQLSDHDWRTDSVKVPPGDAGLAAGHCMGLTQGIMDGFDLDDAHHETESPQRAVKKLFCLPKYTNVEGAMRTVLDFLKRNPSEWDDDPGGAVVLAFRDRFPCNQ